jgi:hypothetical protein
MDFPAPIVDNVSRRIPSSVGGSQNLRPSLRKRKMTPLEKKEKTKKNILAALGDNGTRILTRWNTLDPKDSKERTIQDGIILSLIDQGLSQIQIRMFLGIGGTRIERVRHYEKTPRKAPSHKFSDKTILYVREVVSKWNTEDGFPCTHRKPRQYIILASGKEATWLGLHKDYAKDWDALLVKDDIRLMAYSTFLMYVKFHFPGFIHFIHNND